MIRSLLIVLSCVLLTAQDTTVIILRHAEKRFRGSHAELNSAGLCRAEALAGQLAPFNPEVLFASGAKRTRQTLEPLARRLGLVILTYSQEEEGALAEAILREHAGKTVVVCGHSEGLGTLVRALGHSWAAGKVEDFDRIWILRRRSDGSCILTERVQASMAE